MLTARLIPLTFRSLACAALPLVAACTSSTMRSGDPSTPLADLGRVFHLGGEDSENRDHRQTQTINGVTVAARLLPDDEAQSLYQADLASKGVQAVWLSITNKSPGEQWMLAAYLDPDYYTADEAAHLFRKTWGGIGHRSLQQRFRDLSMRARLEAGKSYEGHVLVPRTEGGRYVEIITNGHGSVRRFGFPLRTPDGHFDFERMHPAAIYEGMKLPDLTRDQLRTRLEQLPPTVTDAKGSAQGDPLNFVLVGDTAQMMAALSECGWAFTHRIDGTTVRRMITAALRGKPYLTAPVSSLYAFDRKQDLAFQRARANISQRNHMRLWLAPYTVDGRSVWVGQVSRDIGVKLTRKSPSLTTHVIDPVVDEARQFVLESLLFRFRISHFGFVRASPPAPPSSPRKNLTGDPYITDGMRLILFLSSGPTSAENVRNLGWAQTTYGPIEFGQSIDTGKSVH